MASLRFDSKQNTTTHAVESMLATASTAEVEYVVRPNTSNLFALPGAVSLANTALLANLTGNDRVRIMPNIDVLPTYADTEDARKRLSESIGLLMVQFRSLLFIMTGQAFTALAASWVRRLVEHKTSKLRQLQILMGIKPSEYVLGHIVFDMTHYCLLLILPLVFVFALETPVASGATVLLCIGYGFTMIPVMHCMSHLFEKPDTAYSLSSALFMIVFIVTFMVYFVCAIPLLAENINVENLDAVRRH